MGPALFARGYNQWRPSSGSPISNVGTSRLDTKETTVAHEPAELRRMTDEELIEAYRDAKTETGGNDPELTPPDDEPASAVRGEMERRGLAPDREDIVPGSGSPEEEPVVEDRA